MNKDLKDEVVAAVTRLYEVDANARKLFDWMSNLRRDAHETTIQLMVSRIDISHSAAVSLARELEEAKCGRFIVGRKGSKSRFEWQYSRTSLAKVAKGEASVISPISDDATLDPDEFETIAASTHMTIPQAKMLLAQSLGVAVEQIDITVRG